MSVTTISHYCPCRCNDSRFRCPHVWNDHWDKCTQLQLFCISHRKTPQDIKRGRWCLFKWVFILARRNWGFKARVRKLKQKLKSLSFVISDLKEKLLISTSCGDTLETSFEGVAKEILLRARSRRNCRICDDLRSFVMTLLFYSAKAYFVCDSLGMWKNTIKAIKSWYSSIHADPGFTDASFAALQSHVEERSIRRLYALWRRLKRPSESMWNLKMGEIS